MTRFFLYSLPFCLLACAPGPVADTPKETEPEAEIIEEEPDKALCVEPSLSVPHHGTASEAVSVMVTRPVDYGASRRFFMRPITIDGTGEGTVVVAIDGPLAIATPDGMVLGQQVTLTHEQLPAELLLTSPVPGQGTLSLTSTATCGSVEQAARAFTMQPTSGRSMAEAPFFHEARLFRLDEQLEVRLPTEAHRDRVGAEYDVYVVPHQSLDEWVANPALENIADELQTRTLGGTDADNTFVAWATNMRVPRRSLVAEYDLVYDFDRDGELSPGDILDGGNRVGFTVADDMSREGPHNATMISHSGGTWRRQEIFYPAAIASFDRPAPLVVISHGNGHEHTWYRHIARHLASWGMVVMSHSNQTGPGIVAASRTTLDNTDYFFEIHDSLANGVLTNRVDNTRIAWIGHSRGGEGIVRAYDRLYTGQWSSPWYDISAIQVLSSIAPTVFEGVLGQGASNPHDVPYHLLAGSSDGDVTGGVDCDVCQFFRLPAVAQGDMAITYVHGASHNVFHDGGGWDDGVGPERVGRNMIHPMQKSIYLSLMGWHMYGHDHLAEVFQRNADVFRPMGVSDELVISSVWRDGFAADTIIVDNFQASDTSTNTMGGTVMHNLDEARSVLLDDSNARFASVAADVANGFTWVSGDGNERGLIAAWSGDASYATHMPNGQGAVKNYDVLSLRVAQTTRHVNTNDLDGPLSFVVELEDEQGTVASLSTDAFGRINAPYPRGGLGPGSGWANEFSTIELPLRGFQATEPLLDLTAIKLVRLRFGPSAGAPVGRVGIDDIYFARRP